MPEALLTFVVPVRHQDSTRDWAAVKHCLGQTVQSITAQTDPRWRAVVVANHGADLPELPAGFSVLRVDFPPYAPDVVATADVETRRDMLRRDKGRRVLAALVATRPGGHVMIVDHDDFVSRRLAAFVAANRGANGWWIGRGYVWADGGRLLFRHNYLSHLCGTSHIIRSDLYGIPRTADLATEAWIKRTLGSHRFIRYDLQDRGTGLAPLPFRGAVYRVGHPGSMSRSRFVFSNYLTTGRLNHTREAAGHLARLRWLTPAIRQEFFGTPA